MRGFGLIFQPGLRRFVALPLLLNILVFAAFIYFGYRQFQQLVNDLLTFLPNWLDWLAGLLWPVFALLALLVIFFTFSLIANLIGAPFNGLLAEAVEQHATGRRSPEQNWAKTLSDIFPSLLGEVRKIGYFLLWSLPFLLLFLIPGVNVAAPLLWIIFSAWMLALQYLDYPMSNHGLSFAAQRRQLRGQRLKTLSFGGTTLLATLIPVVNFLVMPAAVAGATLMWLEVFAGRPAAAQ